jgi:PRTRC genetic system protein C
MEIKEPTRVIIYDGQRLADLNPTLSIDAVVKMYSATMPELATAQITGPETKNGERIYTAEKRLGTKG